MINVLLFIFCSVIFFWGWMIGAAQREKRLREKITKDANDAANNIIRTFVQKRDNTLLQGLWIGQKEYLRIMIESVDAGLSVEQLRYMFEVQMEIVEQELAVEQTKEILI